MGIFDFDSGSSRCILLASNEPRSGALCVAEFVLPVCLIQKEN